MFIYIPHIPSSLIICQSVNVTFVKCPIRIYQPLQFHFHLKVVWKNSMQFPISLLFPAMIEQLVLKVGCIKKD